LAFFILPCAPRRYDPDDVCSPREDDSDQSAFQKTYRDPALLLAVRSTKEHRAVKDLNGILEIDPMLPQVDFALIRIPFETANACEQSLYVFRHSKSPRTLGPDTVASFEVRYDGFGML
jgi:hypothetical protein